MSVGVPPRPVQRGSPGVTPMEKIHLNYQNAAHGLHLTKVSLDVHYLIKLSR